MNISAIICTPRTLKLFILDLNNPSILKFATITLEFLLFYALADNKLVGCHGTPF
jgi:hypothetical protein